MSVNDSLDCHERFLQRLEYYSVIISSFRVRTVEKHKYFGYVLRQGEWYSHSWNQQSRIFEMPSLLYAKKYY